MLSLGEPFLSAPDSFHFPGLSCGVKW